jgi:TolB-like protein/DNA-binding winged helix-turn-helix (wHTH) protein/Flp pilus assembly protein TadD
MCRAALVLLSGFISTISNRIGTVSYSVFLCAVPMHTLPSARVRFGAFELDLSTGELRSIEAPDPNNKAILREQVFQVLRMLVEREGKIVTREEIKGRLWADDTVVDFDHSINATIKSLRRALVDSADSPRYIETLARRGYRLMLPIQYLESTPETAVERDRERPVQSVAEMSENTARVQEKVQRQMKPHWWKAAVVLASVVILVGAGYMSWRHFRSTPPSRKIMLAVLPFENLTGDPNKEYLADGLTEETISQLGRLSPEQLGVIARTSVMGYKHKDEHLDQIGRDLSVQYVLENSLRERGDHLRLTAQLIQVKDQTQLWSQDYDYPAKDILKVEDDVAKAVAHEIRVRLTSQQQAQLAQSHTANPEAFDAYLQGYHFFQGNTDNDADMAVKYYERAIQLDTSYALAWVGLSRARNWQANIGLIPAAEGHRLAREAVERALALNPNLAEAHSQMGRIKQQVDFDWAGADASFQRAVALDPGNPESVRVASFSAAMLGRFDEALQLNRRAVDLDPLNAHNWESLAEAEYYMGQLDRAAADCKKGLELNPEVFSGPWNLSQIYIMQGRPQDALPEIELVRYGFIRAALYAIAYYALGRKKESGSALSELIAKYHAGGAYQIAEVYAFRNQSDKAFEWLDRAYTQHDDGLAYTKVDPLLKNLHGDLRFAALLKKLNLPT